MNSYCTYSNYANLLGELENVKSSREMKKFLQNQIQCHVQIFENVVDDVLTKNTSNHLNRIFFPQLCETCNNTYEDITIFYLKNHHIIPIIVIAFAVISLFGNGITIIYEIQTLIKLKDTQGAKEKKLYKILVLNLCFADLLMAINVITFFIAKLMFKRIRSDLCNTMGVTSALSTQASVSILVIITGYRLYGVLFPFKLVNIKLAVCLLAFIWIAWIVVVSLPLFNESLFAFEFTREIESNNVVDSEKSFTKHITKVTRTVHHLASAINATDDLFSQVLVTANKFQTNEVAVQVLKSFNLVNFEHNTSLVNYYSSKLGCTIELLVEARDTTTTHYSLFIFSLDLVSYVFILIGHLIILKSISKSCFFSILPCLSLRHFSETQKRNVPETINENKQIYMRILIVVVTDMTCGMAICLIGLGHYFLGLVFDCSNNRSYLKIAAPLVWILFPLNSVINPYIYSFNLWKGIYVSCKQRLQNWNFR